MKGTTMYDMFETEGSWAGDAWLCRIFHVDRNLRMWRAQLWDCSYSERYITRRLSVLTPNHRRWWHAPVCGVVFWY